MTDAHDEVGELELIRRLQPFLAGEGAGVQVGTGDDAAVVQVGDHGVAIAVDVLVEGVHFRSDWSTHADVGWKAVAVNASDIAAMGARPTAAVVGLSRGTRTSAEDVEALYTGMAEACERWGIRLVGGDTVDAEALALAVTALGEVPASGAIRRDGAVVGDEVVVVGRLGAAAAAVALWEADRQVPPTLAEAHRRPVALVAAGGLLAELGATALIDCSDGLGLDLSRVCEASGVAARLDLSAIVISDDVATAAEELGVDPLRLVVGGGEDLALIATVPAGRGPDVAAAAAAADGVVAAVVGRIVEAADGPLVGLASVDGTLVDVSRWGYEHHSGDR